MDYGIFPKNKALEKYLEQLTKKDTVVVPPRIAMDFSRMKPIRYYREKGNILIANDRNSHKSIIHIRNGKLKKNGKGFLPDFW